MYSEYIMSSNCEICQETQIRKLSSHRNNKEWEQATVMPVCLVKWCMWICSRSADKENGEKWKETHIVWWFWHQFKAYKVTEAFAHIRGGVHRIALSVFLLRRETFPHSYPLTFNMWQAKPQIWEGWLV